MPNQSLGRQYEESVRFAGPAMPAIAGSSLGAAYEAWFEADQESQWLRDLEERRQLANSDATQVISRADVEAYAAQREREHARGAATRRRTSRHDDTELIPVQRPSAPASGDTLDAPQADAPGASQPAAQTQADDGGKGGILRSSAIMAAGTLVSRVLGLLRAVLTVAALGATTRISNTWDTANTLPNIIYLLLAGGVINAVLVPQITRAMKDADGGKAFTDRIVTLTLTLLLTVTIVFMAAAPLVYWIFDKNALHGDKLHVAWIFSLICLPQIFFYGLYTILGQVLNARGRFGAFMWSPALANIVIIAGLLAFLALYPHGERDIAPYSGWTTNMMLVLGVPATLGIAAQAVVLFPVLKRAGYSFKPNFQFRGVGLRSASTMAGWAFAAVIVQQIGLVFTSQLLNSQPNGAPGKNAQSQAFLLFTLPHSLVTLSLVTALFTRMSIAAGRGETQKVKDDMSTGIRLSGIASVMLTFGSFALVFPLVGAMFGTEPNKMWSIGSIAISMMVGLVPYSLCLVIQRVFYAYNDAKTPFWMQIVCTGTAIALTVPWFFLQDTTMFGHAGTHWVGIGVGLAQTLSNVVQAGLGLVLLRKKLGHFDLHDTVRTYVRMAIAAIIATLVAYGLFKLADAVIDLTQLTALIEISVIGLIFLGLYLGIARALRVSEINDLLNPVLRRLGRA